MAAAVSSLPDPKKNHHFFVSLFFAKYWFHIKILDILKNISFCFSVPNSTLESFLIYTYI